MAFWAKPSKNRNLNTRLTGQQAEDRALRYLTRRNYQFITRNYYRRCGEIDLIMLKDNVLVFVEVRYRATPDQGHPIETVNSKKTKRIIKTAELFVIDHPQIMFNNMRFDIIGVAGNWPNGLSHVTDVVHVDRFYSRPSRRSW